MLGEKIAELFVRIGADTSDLEKNLTASEKRLRSWSRQIGNIGSELSRYITLPIAAAFVLATRELTKFEAEMWNVNSISKFSEPTFQNLTEDVKELAKEIGKMPSDLARGLYDIASSGYQGKEGLDVLKQSAIGAKAGLSTTQESAKALVTVLNAYNMSSTESQRVMDVLFKTVDRGVITFSELGASLGDVVSTAAAAGIPIETLGAAYATMTKGGISASETATSLNRIILSFLDPTKELAEALKAAGYESGVALLNAKGLGGAIEFIQQITGGAADKVAQLGLDTRALKAALNLSRNESKVFSEDLKAMAGAAGAAQAALAEQEKSFASQWEKAKASLAVAGINMTEVFLPAFKSGVALLKSMSDVLSNIDPPIRNLIASILLLVAAIGPMLILIQKLPTVFHAAALGVKTFGAALTWLGAHPVGLVIVALTTLGYIIYKLSYQTDKSTESTIKNTEQAIKNAEAKQEQVEKARGLVQQYERLRSKGGKTNVELAQMNLLLTQIGIAMPELVSNGVLVADAFDRIGKAAEKANKEIRDLTIQKLKLEASTLKQEVDAAKADVKYYQENLKRVKEKYGDKGEVFVKRNAYLLEQAEMKKATKELELAQKNQQIAELQGYETSQAANAKALSDSAALKAMADDRAAAEQTLAEIQKRNASELGKLELERDEALRNAKGPEHHAAIVKDFADRERALKEQLAKEESDLVKQQNEEYQRNLEQQQARMRSVHEAETAAYESALANRLEIAGKSYEADMQRAINTYNQGFRAIQDAASSGEPVGNRYLDLLTSFEKEKLGIEKRYAEQAEAIRSEAARKQIEAEIAKEDQMRSGLEKAIDVIGKYQERAVGFFLGEDALRMYQLEKRHRAELKAIDETIKAEDVKAAAIAAANADYELQLAEIHEDDRQRHKERMEWIADQLRQMTGFASAEGAWKRVVTSGARLAFAGPDMNMTQSFRMPDIAGRDELSRIESLLDRANELNSNSERALNDLNSKLETY